MSSIPLGGPYRFFFFAGDGQEPPHIHVEREDKVAKFWLSPIQLQSAGGYRAHEIRRIERLIEENAETLLQAWNEFFND